MKFSELKKIIENINPCEIDLYGVSPDEVFNFANKFKYMGRVLIARANYEAKEVCEAKETNNQT